MSLINNSKTFAFILMNKSKNDNIEKKRTKD